jgi:NADPH:quinone reductase-like Zn-dependent oxidoreductase
MKAAVLHKFGEVPGYEDFPEPVPENDDQVLISIKAAAIKNLDRARASGTHYASHTHLPAVVGIDGVGVLQDGRRVYAQGITGMIAEKGLIYKNRFTLLPDDLDDATAAALPNAVLGAGMALRFRAGLKKGETVLINGATGVTGQLAVQLAKYGGASKVIATGRNEALLHKLKGMGADVVISLKEEEATIVDELRKLHHHQPIDVVIDYLWGRPMELILQALKGGGLHAFTPRVRIVTVGGMAGEHIELATGTLRSSAIELLGSGIGSLSAEDMQEFNSEVLPELFAQAAAGHLTIDVQTAGLKDIQSAWTMDVPAGRRLVIVI